MIPGTGQRTPGSVTDIETALPVVVGRPDVGEELPSVAGAATAGDVLDEPEEPTLGAAIRQIARVELPSRFYLLMQLAIPAAVQCAVWGAWRIAGWLIVISTYGLWSLAHQRVESEEGVASIGVAPEQGTRWLRFARNAAATIGTIVGGGLMLEMFAQALRQVFGHPGGAG
jgi:hypothetical protein